jgi:iron-sulfur cluster assembly protein
LRCFAMSPQVTPAAISEILRLHRQQLGSPLDGAPLSLQVRLEIVPGGCLQQRYQLSFQDLPIPSAAERCSIPCDGLELILGEAVGPHVQQLTLDYVEDLMGGSFRFDNPALPTTCNCGQSFAWPASPSPLPN